jgi:hypothetical protein
MRDQFVNLINTNLREIGAWRILEEFDDCFSYNVATDPFQKNKLDLSAS